MEKRRTFFCLGKYEKTGCSNSSYDFSFSFSEASIASPPFFSFSKGAITVSVFHTRDFFLVFVAAVDDFFGLGGVAMRSSSSSKPFVTRCLIAHSLRFSGEEFGTKLLIWKSSSCSSFFFSLFSRPGRRFRLWSSSASRVSRVVLLFLLRHGGSAFRVRLRRCFSAFRFLFSRASSPASSVKFFDSLSRS